MGLEKTTGQPTVIKLGDKEFKLYPMTMDDVASLRQHMRNEEIKMLNNVKNESTQIKLIEKAMSKKITEKALDEYIQTLEGMSFLMWKMTRSDMSLEEFGALLEIEGLEKMTTIAKEVNGAAEKK